MVDNNKIGFVISTFCLGGTADHAEVGITNERGSEVDPKVELVCDEVFMIMYPCKNASQCWFTMDLKFRLAQGLSVPVSRMVRALIVADLSSKLTTRTFSGIRNTGKPYISSRVGTISGGRSHQKVRIRVGNGINPPGRRDAANAYGTGDIGNTRTPLSLWDSRVPPLLVAVNNWYYKPLDGSEKPCLSEITATHR